MKERPILFNGVPIAGRMPLFTLEMRQVIRDLRKTQTRRVIKPRLKHVGRKCYPGDQYWVGAHPGGGWWAVDSPDGPPEWMQEDQRLREREGFPCPYGVPGDLRVMREPLMRGADGFACYQDDGALVISLITGEPISWRWKRDILTSIHMPSEAGRTACVYEDIRAERVQDISVTDIKAEGVQANAFLGEHHEQVLRQKMTDLWDSINATRGYSWTDNLWVWVILFVVRE